jgi:hypothetical protein
MRIRDGKIQIDGKIRIRDNHPGSATMLFKELSNILASIPNPDSMEIYPDEIYSIC